MKYHGTDERGIVVNYPAYRQYLDEIRDVLPAGVREFVFCDWFHDRRDPRCPHDAWVESLSIRERASGARQEVRSVEATVRCLGAYHDGHFEMTYVGVVSFALNGVFMSESGTLCGHGDWLMDEIACDGKDVFHEILFSTGSRWIIRCADIHYKWLPK